MLYPFCLRDWRGETDRLIRFDDLRGGRPNGHPTIIRRNVLREIVLEQGQTWVDKDNDSLWFIQYIWEATSHSDVTSILVCSYGDPKVTCYMSIHHFRARMRIWEEHRRHVIETFQRAVPPFISTSLGREYNSPHDDIKLLQDLRKGLVDPADRS